MARPKKTAVQVFEQEEKVAEATTSTEQTKRTRTFRSAEVRLAEIDKKIAFHQKAIDQLTEKRGKIGTARRERKLSFAKVIAQAKSSGKTPEEIAAFLNS
jgi:septal ring factor EnvC (AmiA/AmiB activator)